MDISSGWLFLGALALVGSLIHARNEAKQSKELLAELAAATDAGRKKDQFLAEAKDRVSALDRVNVELHRLLAEKSAAMPWIAELLADLHFAQDRRDAHYLERKKHPARTAAEAIREHAQEKKEIRIQKRLVEYRLAFIDHLFPWISEIGFADAEAVAQTKMLESSEDNDDPVARWLSKDEWTNLSVRERNQRALDRYKKRTKSDWEIGRDFERFIGHQWETAGYDVIYYGAIKGFDDFGRDLIVTDKAGKVALIQCKYWAKHKVIPEAAVFQLLGSTVSYYIERNGKPPCDLPSLYESVQPYLYSSTRLAPRIHDIAVAMGIIVRDEMLMPDWPMVKCNVAADGERIYHLPMDQQYDRVKIAKPGECYVATIAEAEAKKFRRAKRWIPAEA